MGNSTPRECSCQFSAARIGAKIDRLFRRGLVAGLAVRGFELVHLSVPLAGEFTFRRVAVRIRARTIIEPSLQVNPDLRIRTAVVNGRRGRFGETKPHQHSLSQAQLDLRWPWSPF